MLSLLASLPLFFSPDINFLTEAKKVIKQKEETLETKPLENENNTAHKKVFVGQMGSTGHSTGPHYHIQANKGVKLTPDTLNAYFRFSGKTVDWDDVTADEKAHAARGSRGIDIAVEEGSGSVLEALSPVEVSPWKWDSRSGNWRWVTFENGSEFVIAHMLDPQDKNTPIPAKIESNVENVEEKLDSIINNLNFNL